MKAIVIEEFGGPEKLTFKDVQTPKPLKNEVLVKVKYAGVNPVDWKIREGLLASRLPHEFPIILGWDVAGTIAEVGKEVSDLKVGDEVYSYARKPTVKWGTYAEYVAIDAKNVVLKPRSISFAESAAIPLSGLTAWQALFDVAHLQQGETILILGGSGGVGSLAIQFAKVANAKVIATASPKKHSYIKALGVDLAIDHTANVLEQVRSFSQEGVDVVFDCFGKEAFTNGLKALKKGGRIVSILEHLDPAVAQNLGITASYLFVTPNGAQLKQIAELIDAKKVIQQPVEAIPLHEAHIAQEKLRSGSITGKLVLQV